VRGHRILLGLVGDSLLEVRNLIHCLNVSRVEYKSSNFLLTNLVQNI
jgi:hypothetical protein